MCLAELNYLRLYRQEWSKYNHLHNGKELMDKIFLATLLAAQAGMASAASSQSPSQPTTDNVFTKEKQITVIASPDCCTEADNQAGAGFVTEDISVGPVGNLPWIEAPWSANTITSEMLTNQQDNSVSELLRYAPSSQMQARGGMDVGRPQSRGMQGSVVANSRLDGLNIVATTAFPVEMLAWLDVLNSLTGALYGPASPAGQFNFTAKRAGAETLNRITVGYQSRNSWQGHADFAGHIDSVGYRLNLLNEDGEGSVADSTRRRKLAALALDWNIQPGTQLQLDVSHYQFIKKGMTGSFSYGDTIPLPAAPDSKNKNYTLPTSGSVLTTDTVSTHLLHYFNDSWSMTAGVGYQQADRAMRSVSGTLSDSNGTLSRSLSDSAAAGRFRVLSNMLTLNGHLQTGSLTHDLALATSGYIWSIYAAKGASQRYNLGETSFFDPAPLEEPAAGRIIRQGARYKSSENSQQSLTVGDTLRFTPQWSAMIYLSHSWLSTRNYNRQGQKTKEINDNGFSPMAALLYKITPSVMAYISYADSLEQGGTAPTGQNIVNEGQTLNPYRSRQYETGLKSEFNDINLGAALFWLQRPFAYVDPADNRYKEQGEQRNRGVELTASGNVWQQLNIYSGITFLDPRLKNTLYDSTRNKRVVGVAKIQANVLLEYSLPALPAWVYSANLHYTGKRAANQVNTYWTASYTTLDLGARYTSRLNNLPTTFRLSVKNISNKHYWASLFPSDSDGNGGSASAFAGAGREIRATVTVDF